MLRSQHSTEILLREFGSSFTNTHFCSPSTYSLTKSFPTFFKGSQTVWVASRQNLTITLDSRGRVVMYNSLLDNQSTILINSPNHAFKCILTTDSLIIISKTQEGSYVNFSKYLISELQALVVSPIPLLASIQIKLSAVQEINERDLLVSIINSSTFQVWSLKTSSLQCSFPYNPDLYFVYANLTLVYWQQENSRTSIGVIRDNKMKTLSLNCGNKIYLCEVVCNTLVVGMKGCHLQVINLEDLSVEVIKKGVPLQVFRLNQQDSVLAVYANESVTVISEEIFDFGVVGRDFGYCESEELVVLINKDGKGVVNGNPIDLQWAEKKNCQLGVNPDTRQLICAEKGMIYIFD